MKNYYYNMNQSNINKCNNMITNRNNMGNQSQIHHYNNMITKYATQFSQRELRLDLAEWYENFSREDISSSLVLTIVQHIGSPEQQVLPQEYKTASAACMSSTRLISEAIHEIGARSITTEIRNDRFYVTTDNHYQITLVID